MRDLLPVALSHAARNWRVLPLHSPLPGGGCSCRRVCRCGRPCGVEPRPECRRCRTPGKHPRITNWTEEATTDEAQIRKWWGMWPEANVGIATGRASGLWVLDVDPRHGGDETLAALERQHGALPDTVEVLTQGAGRHLYWQSPPDFEVRNIQKREGEESPLGPGLDLRGDGGLVVAPGSRGEGGRGWEWEIEHHPDSVAVLASPAWLLALVRRAVAPGSTRAAGPASAPDRIPHGRQHNTLVSLAGAMRRSGLAPREIEAALWEINTGRCERPGTREAIHQIAHSMVRYQPAVEEREPPPNGAPCDASEIGIPAESGAGGNGAQPNGAHPPAAEAPATEAAAEAPGAEEYGDWVGTEPDGEGYHNTDLGNSMRLVASEGPDLRYCRPWGRWYAWDGARWAADLTGEVERRAKRTVRGMLEESRDLPSKAGEGLGKWAFASEAAAKLRNMVELAESELPVLPEAFDADPWLLSCANGTLDLRSGDLRAHDRGDLITKRAGAPYMPGASCPAWEMFLVRALGGSDPLITFLQRAVGYALTGDISEQVLFLLYGTGANGKSTFLETVRALLGDYARQADFSTFLAQESDRVRNDVARLVGTRFVSAVEVEGGRHLAEVLVKQIVSGDAVTARFLHREYFEFQPTFKVFLAANHKPAIRGTDHGIWRRIRLVPFTVTIPEGERDRSLAERLRAELPGILAWAVQGCLEWQREGLGTPPEVLAATESYREEMDVMAGFFAEVCVETPAARGRAGELFKQYLAWCERNHEHALTQRAFGMRLTERGHERRRGTGNAHFWLGIGLREEREAGALDMGVTGSDPSDPE